MKFEQIVFCRESEYTTAVPGIKTLKKGSFIMDRHVGVVARGIRGPIIRPGDNLVNIAAGALADAVQSEHITLSEHDVLGITEAVVAKSQNNFVSLEDIKTDIQSKYGREIGVVFPILSRNRFSNILKAVAMAVDKVYIQLSYPGDEVGNKLISQDRLDETAINPFSDVLTEEEFYGIFKTVRHEFTDVDYVQYYKSLCDGKATVIFSNDPRTILKYTKAVLAADIHTRKRTKRILKEAGAEIVYGLDDIMNSSINGSGYNPDYGVLGSNLSSEDRLKLFPRDCHTFVEKVQKEIASRLSVAINVMVYGDGGFKDPVGGIWELADPVVSPGFTDGLKGVPNELKLKYIADTELKGLSQEEAQAQARKLIDSKPKVNTTFTSQGTTPRKIVDLLGSLCDLTSGSGDKGTPFILIQGYFDNYADE